ncbi:MAG: ABC transporter substrate-binding protein [Lentisphaeria bacterium]|nr:ABC transporter substrate-binding protein [Lentisphaeria bacterium]
MRRLFSLLLLACILCLAACSDERKSAPGGVVSLSPALTELVCHLGQERKLVARSTACDWPESVKSLPTAGNFAEPELERILAMKPALVVSNEFVNPKDADALRQAGIAVELHPCDGFDDYRAWVALMGKLLDCPREAENELKRTNDRIAGFEAELEASEKKPLRALYVIWDSPLLTAGADSLPDAVGRLAGLKNIVKSEKGYPSISLEFVLKEDPDVIVWFAHGKDWKSNPSWSGIRAIREGRVLIPRDDSALLRPGPRIFDGIADLKTDLETMFAGKESAGTAQP